MRVLALLVLTAILQRPAIGTQRPGGIAQRPIAPATAAVVSDTLNDGLQAFYCFDNTSSTVGASFLGNDCLGTKHFSKIGNGATTNATAKHGAAAVIANASGSSHYLVRTSTDFWQPNSAFTVAVWGRLLSGTGQVVLWQITDSSTIGAIYIRTASNVAEAFIRNSAGQTSSAMGFGFIDSTYKMIVIEYDHISEPGKLYGCISNVNCGVSWQTLTTAGTAPNTLYAWDRYSVLRGGGGTNSSGIDSLAMWNRKLTLAEVSRLVNGGDGRVPPY